MMTPSLFTILSAGTALAGLVPASAHAQTTREVALETRVNALEVALQDLRGELRAARASTIPASVAAASSITVPAARPGGPSASTAFAEVKPGGSAPATTDGFHVAGTTIKLNGFIKTWASVSRYSGGNIAPESVGRDFFYPGLIPVGARGEGNSFEAHAKQTRIDLATETSIAGHVLKGLVEFDFQVVPGTQGNQRVVNGYNPGLRRAFFTYDNWLIGQEWTNFQYVGALPETTDFIGPSEGTVFIRQTQIRYSRALNAALSLSVAAENPETASTNVASAAIVENADDRLPDFTARLNYKTAFGEFSLAGLVRKLTIDTGTLKERTTGWGVSLAGKVPLTASGRSDIRFMVTHGDGIGRYVGLNLAPDAVFVPVIGAQMLTPSITAGFVAVKIGWTNKLRSTLIGSAQSIAYAAGGQPIGASKTAWSTSANLFYSPIKNIDFGIELRHAERKLIDGQIGKLDRGELAARYSF